MYNTTIYWIYSHTIRRCYKLYCHISHSECNINMCFDYAPPIIYILLYNIVNTIQWQSIRNEHNTSELKILRIQGEPSHFFGFSYTYLYIIWHNSHNVYRETPWHAPPLCIISSIRSCNYNRCRQSYTDNGN